MAKPGDFIWLFGENLSETANNNSFHFWNHVVDRDDGIRKYFILKKTPQNVSLWNAMDAVRREHVVWRDSLRHLRLYLDADMLFVTLSYRDVRPEQALGKALNLRTHSPVVYLQHGTLAMKRLGYTMHSYDNNMFRFVYYNPHIRDVLVDQKQFKDYQLYYGEFHPRYKELVRRARLFEDAETKQRQILWFLTWREYLGNNLQTEMLMRSIRKTINDPRLVEHLESNGIRLRIALHSFFDPEKLHQITGDAVSPAIDMVHPAEMDIMEELVRSELLVTDYSSVGFDFTLLGKPVILYQPDLESYLAERETYCSVEELERHGVRKSRQLIETILGGSYGLNEFFTSRMPDSVDFDAIEQGAHIDRMCDYFTGIQRRSITFVGYNYFGIGGTTSATKALAEALLEKGFMVQLMSLKKNAESSHPPALNVKSLYTAGSRRKTERLKRWLFRSQRHFGDIKHDKNVEYLTPYVGYGLRRFLSRTRSAVLVSTRESLHSAVSKATSPSIKDRVHFFHCSAEVLDDVYPGVVDELKNLNLAKVVFPTELSRQDFATRVGFRHYSEHLVLGNTLESSRMIERSEIVGVENKGFFRLMCLLRLSRDRADDIVNLIRFGEHLRDNNISSVAIDVYGAGDYRDAFLDLAKTGDLDDLIVYKGSTTCPTQLMKQYDAVVDFSRSHSFGMIYLEGVLNGKPVFCIENSGSLEVLGEIRESFFGSHEELVAKVLALPDLSVEELRMRYDIIMQRYSRRVVADRFLSFLDFGENS